MKEQSNPNLHGEVIGSELTEAIPDAVREGFSKFTEDTPPGMTPVTKIEYKLEDGSIEREEIPVSEIEGIEPGEEPGKYNLIRSKVEENKKVIFTMVITGAALLALFASRRYKKNK